MVRIYVKHVLNECGFSNVWMYPVNCNSKWVGNAVKLRLKDQFIQSWYEFLHKSEKGYNYRIFKTKFEFEHYLNVLPFPLWNQLCRFRVCNHKLPVEVGRFNNLPRYMRTCHCCNSDQLGDKYHFSL